MPNNNKCSVDIKRQFYTMATTDGESAEISMYGEIVEQIPTDWWGEPIDGDYITQSEFLADLEKISGCKNVTIRMNSLGGDAAVSILIHNRLRELSAKGTKLTCIVDGVAMSGGSLIMCACDTVRVNPSSLVMIHKCWSFLWGCYNADEMRKCADANDAYDKSQVSIYKRKCGLSETVLMHMMADTTYMSGKEAVEKGFADEVMEDAEPLNIAASANGRELFVCGKKMHLAPGTFAPDNIPTVNPDAKTSVETHKNTPAVTGSEEGGNSMTTKELREQYPEQVAEVEAEARAAVDTTAAVNAATQSERERISAIDEVAGLFDAELVREAKYGDNACSVQEMTFRAAKKAAKNGTAFMRSLEDDNVDSKANDVSAAVAEPEKVEAEKSPAELMAEARAAVKELFGK